MIVAAASATTIQRPPPSLPPMWTGMPTANYTMPGYDGGTLNIEFYSDCSQGAALQRMKTVYPDTYTVITYCDKGWQYLLQPQGIAPPFCEIWPVAADTCELCSCPFCLNQDAEGRWGSQGAGAVTWISGPDAATSPVTGEPVLVWHGTQPNGNSVEHSSSSSSSSSSTSGSSVPVTQYITSPNYLSVGTHFAHFATTFNLSTFDRPALCPPLPSTRPLRSRRGRRRAEGGVESVTGASGGAEGAAGAEESAEEGAEATSDGWPSRRLGRAVRLGWDSREARPGWRSQSPEPWRGHAAPRAAARLDSVGNVGGVVQEVPAPPLPLRLSAVLITNFSQPGYEGGNVNTSFTADCSLGAAKQVISTTYGNFHTVLVNCAEGIVYRYDLAGIECSTAVVGADVDPRICETCALPFGLRDTSGVYRTGRNASQRFEWGCSTVDPNSGDTTYHGLQGGSTSEGARALQLNFTFGSDGVPLTQNSSLPGWQSLIVTFYEYTTEINASLLTPPACFGRTAGA